MQALVVKALSKYFQIFINDFKKEQFNLSVLQGKGQLNDLNLNEKVVQELLLIPPNMKVIKATCSELVVKMPSFTKINKVPVVLTLSEVNIDLCEPLEVEPMPNLLSKLRKQVSDNSKEGGSQIHSSGGGSGWDILNNLKVEVKEVHLTMRTLLRKPLVMAETSSTPFSSSASSSSWRPELRIDLKNVLIQSTNSQWQVVANEKTEETEGQLQFDYKQILCGTYSMYLVAGRARDEMLPIINDLPDVEIRFKGKLDPKSEKYVEVQIDTSLSELSVSWNERQFHMMVELYANLQECFDRDVPLNDDLLSASALFKKRLKGLKSIDFRYNMLVDKWSLELKEGEDAGGACSNSFVFSGRGLQLQLSPKKRIETKQEAIAPILSEEPSISTSSKKQKKEQKQKDTDLLNSLAFVDEVFTSPHRKKLHESSLVLELSQFFFREVQRTGDEMRAKNMMYGCLDIVPGAPIHLPEISTSPSPTSSTSTTSSTPPPLSPTTSNTSLSPSDKIVRIKIVHRWTKLSQPASTQIEVAVQGFRLVLEKQVWLRLLQFFSRHPIPKYAPLEDRSEVEELENEDSRDTFSHNDEEEGETANGAENESATTLNNFFRKLGLASLKQWYDNSKLHLKIRNVGFDIPDEEELFSEEHGDPKEPQQTQKKQIKRTLKFELGYAEINTQPEWERVPRLHDCLSLLPHTSDIQQSQSPELSNKDTLPNKIELLLEDARIDIESKGEGEGEEEKTKITTILQPTSISFSGRLLSLRPSSANNAILQLELSAFFDEIDVFVSPEHSDYIERTYHSYKEWLKKLEILNPDVKSKSSKKIGTPAQLLDAGAKIDHSKVIELKKAVADNDPLSALSLMLKWVRFGFVLMASKGSFVLPIKKFAYRAEGARLINGEKMEYDDKDALSTMLFDNLAFAIENGNDTQQAILRIKTIKGDELYIPKSPADVFIKSLETSEDKTSPYSISFSLQRSPPNSSSIVPSSKVVGRFDNLQLISKARAKLAAQESLQTTITYLQQLANMLSHFLGTDTAKKRFEIAAKSLAYFDLEWEFEMGNCEALLYDSPEATQPYTTLRLANFDKQHFTHLFSEVNQQLIESKIRVATSETQRDELKNKIVDLQAELREIKALLNNERAKHKKEMSNLEQQLIAAKLALVEAQTSMK